MTLHVPVMIEQDEDGVFIVSVPTLRGCHSYGYTVEEAMANIREVIVFCLEEQKSNIEQPEFVGVYRIELSV